MVNQRSDEQLNRYSYSSQVPNNSFKRQFHRTGLLVTNLPLLVPASQRRVGPNEANQAYECFKRLIQTSDYRKLGRQRCQLKSHAPVQLAPGRMLAASQFYSHILFIPTTYKKQLRYGILNETLLCVSLSLLSNKDRFRMYIFQAFWLPFKMSCLIVNLLYKDEFQEYLLSIILKPIMATMLKSYNFNFNDMKG